MKTMGQTTRSQEDPVEGLPFLRSALCILHFPRQGFGLRRQVAAFYAETNLGEISAVLSPDSVRS